MISFDMFVQTVIQVKEFKAVSAVIDDLLYCIIGVDILIDFWERLFIDFRESSVLINNVVCSIIFLLKLTIAIVVVFVIVELIILICSLIIVYFRLLQIVKSINIFISLIV